MSNQNYSLELKGYPHLVSLIHFIDSDYIMVVDNLTGKVFRTKTDNVII